MFQSKVSRKVFAKYSLKIIFQKFYWLAVGKLIRFQKAVIWWGIAQYALSYNHCFQTRNTFFFSIQVITTANKKEVYSCFSGVKVIISFLKFTTLLTELLFLAMPQISFRSNYRPFVSTKNSFQNFDSSLIHVQLSFQTPMSTKLIIALLVLAF